MKRTNWEVTEAAVRPARPDGTCFYCNQAIGLQHKESCVFRVRTIVLRVEVEIVVPIPESFSEEDINFKYNEGSSCSDNVIRDIMETQERRDKIGNCMCSFTKCSYVREATENDEVDCIKFIAEEES